MTTGKAIPLTIWTFVSKVMLLLFKTFSKFVCLLISWLQSLSTVIMEPMKIESAQTERLFSEAPKSQVYHIYFLTLIFNFYS